MLKRIQHRRQQAPREHDPGVTEEDDMSDTAVRPADFDEEQDDREWDEFIGPIILSMRRGVVASLLRGNDAQCFSTAQYEAAYRKAYGADSKPDLSWLWADGTLAVKHLHSTGMVRELVAGVWVAKNIAKATGVTP